MGRSTIGGGGAAATEVATSFPWCYLGTIKGREKISEVEMKEIKKLDL